jgi:hypothetical protein
VRPFDLNRFKSRRLETKIKHVEENGKRYAIRDGKRFEIGTLDQGPPPKTKRKAFKLEFVAVPMPWVEALEQAKNINTYRLAHRIQLEKFQRERIGGEIVLSAKMTGIRSHTNRYRAAKELEKLGLIKLYRDRNNTLRVILT